MPKQHSSKDGLNIDTSFMKSLFSSSHPPNISKRSFKKKTHKKKYIYNIPRLRLIGSFNQCNSPKTIRVTVSTKTTYLDQICLRNTTILPGSSKSGHTVSLISANSRLYIQTTYWTWKTGLIHHSTQNFNQYRNHLSQLHSEYTPPSETSPS